MSLTLFRVILPVSDIDKAARFWAALSGNPGVGVSPGRHYFDCGGVILACFDSAADGDGNESTPNPEYLYFTTPNLEQIRAALPGLGGVLAEGMIHGAPAGEILKRPWGERSFYAEDPFGNKLCFVDPNTVFRK